MAIPQSAYPPPFNVTRASHLVLTAKDLGASRAFYVDALGFVVSDEDKTTLFLRGLEEACHHSLVIKTGAAAECERVGLRVYTENDLDSAYSFLRKSGLSANWAEVPHQGRTLHVADAVGTPLELCATMDVKPRMVVSFESFRSGAPQRLDHFQIVTPSVQQACDFYASLGFRLSEFVAVDRTDDLVFVFMQRKGNPHDIVFAAGTGPRLHHVAFTAPDINHVVSACDVAGRIGFGPNIEHGPGRHGPGHALFVYFRDPDGHRIELFTTHYQIMDIENEPIRWELSYMKNRPWGFPPRECWYRDASSFSGILPQEPEKGPNPFTLEELLMHGETDEHDGKRMHDGKTCPEHDPPIVWPDGC
jgi:catechol 2,3-dioxygenase